MKKAITFFALIILYICGKAQQSEIIYVDFQPDLVQNTLSDTLYLDFDNDGIWDIRFLIVMQSAASYPVIANHNSDWSLHSMEKEDTIAPYPTLPELSNWIGAIHWTYQDWCPPSEKIAVRHQKDGKYYYGWFRVLAIDYKLAVDKMAYCTIPDYPLKWGQTNFTGIKENDKFYVFATLHPNPTDGFVTITGENLQQAEVFNLLGQRVLSAQGRDNELHIDMAGLPTGIYFVNVTDEEGRKCVRKVVKE